MFFVILHLVLRVACVATMKNTPSLLCDKYLYCYNSYQNYEIRSSEKYYE